MVYGLKFRFSTNLVIKSVKKNEKALGYFKNFSSACLSIKIFFQKDFFVSRVNSKLLI